MDFDKIKRLFVVEEENKNRKTKVSETKKSQRTQKTEKPQIVDASKDTTSRLTKTTTTNLVPSAAKLNEKILQNLSKAIEKADLPGEDYLEYIQAVHSLKDLPLSDEMRYKTAFTTLSTRGLTYKKILESADYYIKILENEKSKFYEALKQKSNTLINNNKSEITQLEAQNKEKAQLIAKLTSEIKENQQKIKTLTSKVNGSEAKIKGTEQDFLFTFDYMVKKIKSNIEKVNSIKE